MANKKKKNSKVIRQIFGITCLCIAILLGLNAGSRIVLMVELRAQKEQVEAELESLRDENANLSATKTKLEDPNYIQTYARGAYMFSGGDEKVFYLPSSGK